METLLGTVDAGGQITLPNELRQQFSIVPGDKLAFSTGPGESIMIKKTGVPGSSAGCGKKFLKKNQPPVTIQQMEDAIGEYVGEKFKNSSRA